MGKSSFLGYNMGDMTGSVPGDMAVWMALMIGGGALAGGAVGAGAGTGVAGGATGGTAGGAGALGMEAGLGGTAGSLGPAAMGGAEASFGAGGFGATMAPEAFGMTGAQYEAVPGFGGTIGAGTGVPYGGVEAGLGETSNFLGPGAFNTAEGAYGANVGGPMPSSPWYKTAGNPLPSTETLYKGAMINMLASSIFGGGGQKQQALPASASAPQVGGRGGQYQSNAMQQLALLQAAQNARRRPPGIFG